MARYDDPEYIKSYEACVEKLIKGTPTKTDIPFATTISGVRASRAEVYGLCDLQASSLEE